MFDLVLPCYNPPPGWVDNILTSLARLRQLLPQDEPNVILVNDGSLRGIEEADITRLQAEIPSFTYLFYPQNQGKGYALRVGVAQTQHPLCLFTDIDFPYEETSIAAVYHVLRAGGVDVAAGVRDSSYYTAVPAARVFISRSLRFLTKQLLSLPVNDTQCGLKGFNTKAKPLFLRSQTHRYLFDLEFLYLAGRQRDLQVQAVPVRLKPNVVFSRMSPQILLTEGRSFIKLLLGQLR